MSETTCSTETRTESVPASAPAIASPADMRKRRMLRELRYTGPEGVSLMITCRLFVGFALGLALALLPVTQLQQAHQPDAAAAPAEAAVAAVAR